MHVEAMKNMDDPKDNAREVGIVLNEKDMNTMPNGTDIQVPDETKFDLDAYDYDLVVGIGNLHVIEDGHDPMSPLQVLQEKDGDETTEVYDGDNEGIPMPESLGNAFENASNRVLKQWCTQALLTFMVFVARQQVTS